MDTDARFCWTELSTTDRDKAGKFYGRLFGWDGIPQPLWTRSGQSIDYTLLSLRGQNVGGMYPMVGGQRRQGARPLWLSYVFVADAAACTARARELGATLLAGPMDVFDLGRLAILRDPEGALFGAWQAMRLGGGFQTRNQPGCASWFEHVSEDVARAARFYGALFGWSRRDPGERDGGRVLLGTSAAPVAGFTPRAWHDGKLRPQWLTFFQVPDCEAACQKLVQLQGSVIAAPDSAAESGLFAVASDPQGAVFGLLTPERA